MSKSERKSLTPAETSHAHGYEFGGPIGAAGISFIVPFMVYLTAFACNDISGCPPPSLLHPTTFTLAQFKRDVGWPGVSGLASWSVTGWVLGYYLLSLTLQAVLPGTETQGVKLRSGGRLHYKLNAFSSALVILAGAGVGTYLYGAEFVLWRFINTNHIQIVTANVGLAFALAWFVYLRSFAVKPHNKQHRELAAGGTTGNLIYDWFIGRELNPRVEIPLFGTVDIKAFMEMRPGLLGWLLMDFAYIAKQYQLHSRVSDSILLVTAFQSIYVMDALYMEPAILTTMDIVTDGFGFMLAVGDVGWLPFIYSLQARYLAMAPVDLGITGIAGVLAVQGLGYYIFRASNNEKNRFRTNPKDPQVAHLKHIETSRGTRLLVSGWWGTARHINYLGDWIMAWSYCLPTGLAGYVVTHPSPHTAQIVPGEARGWGMLISYFYIIYFAVLLVHRDRRDDAACAKKYGKDWEEYKRRVPSRIIPYLY